MTHCLDLSVWRQGRDFALPQLAGFVLSEHIHPLADMEFDEEVLELLEVGVNVRFKGCLRNCASLLSLHGPSLLL